MTANSSRRHWVLIRQCPERYCGPRRFASIAGTVLLLSALAGTAQPNPDLPIISNQTFVVTNSVYGAVGNGTTNNAAAIQSAINDAGAHGGGTVLIPANGSLSTYLCGPILLTNGINFQIDSGATLKMLPFGSYPTSPGIPDFITATNDHDVEISGSGTIDGSATNGSPGWWDGRATSERPLMIRVDACQRVLIQNLHLKNPPKMHIGFKNTGGNITIQGLFINTSSSSPNTDGIDLVGTNCLVQNCSISDGDDNIAFSPVVGTVSCDTLISNCTFGAGHGVSIGSNTAGGMSNLTVTACTFSGTDYGIRMKSDNNTNVTGSTNGRGGVVQNLTYSNLTMTNITKGAIVIYSYYNEVGTPTGITPATAAGESVGKTNIPVWRNITISNVTASAASGAIPGIIWGRKEAVVSNVTLSAVTITGPSTFDVYNARDIQVIDSQVSVPNGSNNLTLFNAEVLVTNSTPSTNVVSLGGLAKPGTNNSMAFFNAVAAITDTNMLGTGPITLGSSTLSFKQGAVNSLNDFSIVLASTLSFTSGTNSLGGLLTGPGTLTVSLPGNTVLSLQGDASGFEGVLTVTNSGTLRFNQGTNTWGDAQAAFDAGSSGTINNHSSSGITVFLGALSGGSGSRLQGSDQAGPGVDTYVIGGLNLDTEFAGTVTNGTSATTPHLVAVTKIGTGTLTLSGANTYGGGTMVSNGTLVANNTTGSGTGTGAVTVVSSAALGGSGVISGPVTVNGTLSPDGGPGTLTVSNSLVLGAGAVLQYALGTSSDLTVVSGNLALDGTLQITDSGGFANGTYTLFTYGGTLTTNGTPSILAIGSTPDATKSYAIDITTAGQIRLVVGSVAPPPVDPFTAWQLLYFGCTNAAICPQIAGDADPDGDGISNTNEFLAGTDPTNSLSALRIIGAVRQGTDVIITWTTAGGRTNVVQATAGDGAGEYATNFTDLSSPIIVSGTGDVTTSYVDVSGATNVPARFYRVRLVP